MKITNKHALPQPIYDAICNDAYEKGDWDISVTSLLKPPRMVVLRQKHDAEIEVDAMDLVWSLDGQVIHTIFERADTTAITERRLIIERLGWRIGGKFDRLVLQEGALTDYKRTSAFTIMKALHEGEWAKQQNLYKHMLTEYKITGIKRLLIWAWAKDWSRQKARSKDYPQQPIVCIELPLFSEAECEALLLERVKLHQEARTVLPNCTDEERWTRPAKFAVMKEGAVKAKKLCDSEAEATQWIADQKYGKSLYIEKRPLVRMRCGQYCEAALFCDQWKSEHGSVSDLDPQEE